MHDQHRSLVHVETPEASFELVSVRNFRARFERVRRVRQDQRVDMNFDGLPPAAPARFAIARVDEQAVEPWPEPIGISQAGQPAPGSHQSFLGCLLGLSVVTKDQAGNGMEPSDLGACQLFERVVIARHRLYNEIPLHRVSRCRGPDGRARDHRAGRAALGSRIVRGP